MLTISIVFSNLGRSNIKRRDKMKVREALVKVTSEDIEVKNIDRIEADFGELRVYMKDERMVFFELIENFKTI